MTRDADHKREVRARMRATGERYTQARSALFGPSPAGASGPRPHAQGGTVVNEQILAALDRDGYAVVRDVVPPDTVRLMQAWVDEQVAADLAWRLAEVDRRRAAGEADVRAFPRGSEGVLGIELTADERLLSLTAGITDLLAAIGTPSAGRGWIVGSLPGWGGHEGLHCELPGPAPEIGQWDGTTVLWPFSPTVGVRVVPGSHRVEPVFTQPYGGAIAPHPDEVHLDAVPGDAILWSLHLWKSGLLNATPDRRTGITALFGADHSLSATVKERWATAELLDGGAPWDPGNHV